MSAADTTSRPSPGPIRATSSFILGIFTRNLVSKVAALALAVLLWITVRQDLTRAETFEARVVPDLAANLMLLTQPPTTVTIVLEGPTSEIDRLRRSPEKVEIVLPVSVGDLNDQLVVTRTFSVENIEHNFGEHVRITQVVDGAISLQVAVRGEERKPVGKPVAAGLPPEWEARFDLLNPEVRLTGPQELLNTIIEVETTPISANRLLEGVEGDEYSTIVELELTEAAIADRIHLVRGDRMECRVTLTRSLTQQELDIPFTVFFEKADWPVVVNIIETNLVKRLEGGDFTIHLVFRGSPTDLTRLDEARAAGRVWAYVRAMDLPYYAQGKAGRGSIPNVHLELPTELLNRVSLIPPPSEDIDLEALKKPEEDK